MIKEIEPMTFFAQGESTQAELQRLQAAQQTLQAQLQQSLEQAEKQKQGLEARLQLHVTEESGLIAMLAEDFALGSELQQNLTTEGRADAAALQELRKHVGGHNASFVKIISSSLHATSTCKFYLSVLKLCYQ